MVDLPAQAGAQNIMYSVYMIKSRNQNWYYVGMTENLSERILRHNNKRERTTKHYAPFKLIFHKEFVDRKAARDYEKFLKVRCNKEQVIKALVAEW